MMPAHRRLDRSDRRRPIPQLACDPSRPVLPRHDRDERPAATSSRAAGPIFWLTAPQCLGIATLASLAIVALCVAVVKAFL